MGELPGDQSIIVIRRHSRAFSVVLAATVLGLLPLLLAACGNAEPAGRPAASTSASAIPAGLVKAAATADISNVKRIGPAGPNHLGFFSGSDQSGQTVIAVASDNEISPFVPRQHMVDYLASNKLYVHSADSGSGGTVDSRWVLGEVSPDVARVAIQLQGGGTSAAPLVDQAFVYSSSEPSMFASAVVAYDAEGKVLATKDLGPAAAPAGG
jgi:hypothetical protein